MSKSEYILPPDNEDFADKESKLKVSAVKVKDDLTQLASHLGYSQKVIDEGFAELIDEKEEEIEPKFLKALQNFFIKFIGAIYAEDDASKAKVKEIIEESRKAK